MATNNISTAAVSAVEPPYPGTALRIGSSGTDVSRMQSYLNTIRAEKYPTLGSLTVDGKFGNATHNTTMQYQALSNLAIDGVIGRATWDSIVQTYNEITGGSGDVYPGTPLRPGARGEDVMYMQRRLNALARVYTGINTQTEDGIYGTNMTNAARRFQSQFGLSADGIIGKNTWDMAVRVYNAMQAGTLTHVVTRYPGYVMNIGSSGDSVRFAQSYLNGVNGRPILTVDGKYGADTKRVVGQFQAIEGLKVDGILGSATWAALVAAFNAAL